MKRLLIFFSATFLAFSASAPEGKRWWSFVEALANDGMQGRETGSEAYRKAARYVASQFEQAGLKPAGIDGYFQPVAFTGRKIVEPECSLELIRNGKAEKVQLGDDATISLRVDPAPSVEAPLIFAGYGLTVPEMKYDDLAGLDLRGKIVVYLAGAPNDVPGPLAA